MSESRSMTLWDLEQTLVGLMQIVSDPEATEEERTVAGQELQQYVAAEVKKVDGIRAYLRHCDVMTKAAADEAQRQAQRAKLWKNRAERLEQMCIDVMQFAGMKKLEGKTGSISVRGNGGLQPLTITDASLIPDECCVWRGMITGPAWKALRQLLGKEDWERWTGRQDVQMMREPLNGAVRAACEATKEGVTAGARLEPRGVHLRVE